MRARAFLRRAALVAPTLLGVAVVVFFLLRIAPGDPIALMTPPGASQLDILRLRELYGLDQSIPQQFIIWLKLAVQGDLGTSISLRQPVSSLISHHLPATLELSALALLIALAVAVPSAVLADAAPAPIAAALDAANSFALAVPDFLWALLFILLFAVIFHLFPVSGRFNPQTDPQLFTNFLLCEALITGQFKLAAHLLSHLFLPALALALPLAGAVARALRNAINAEHPADYILMARSNGASPLSLAAKHALPNAAAAVLPLTAVQTTFLIGGSVLVERIFSFPGVGNLAVDAVVNRDLPLIQGVVLTFAVVFILINILADALAPLLNPQLRRA